MIPHSQRHCAALLSLALLVADVFSANCPTPNPVTEIGQRVQIAVAFQEEDRFIRISRAEARYIQARIHVEESSCAWRLTVRDASMRPVQILTADDFRQSDSHWTSRVFSSVIFFQLSRCQGTRTPKIVVSEYIAVPQRSKNPYYSKQTDVAQYKDLYGPDVPPEIKALGDNVAFLTVSWGRTAWTCSGVMLTSSLLLTNWHCGGLPDMPGTAFWNEQIVKDTLVDLSWDGDAVSWDFGATGLLASDRALDFALLKVKPLGAVGVPAPVTISSERVERNAPLILIHHPEASTKQVTMGCSVADSAYKSWQTGGPVDGEFTHRCDSESGSSGAPLFDASDRLVGLHHLGFDFDETTCKPRDAVNKAVHISSILDSLRKNHDPKVQEVFQTLSAQVQTSSVNQ